jgi:hypothetical protein
VSRLPAACMLIAALLPRAAMADDPPDSTGAPTSLRLDLVGSVPSHCGFKTAPPQSAVLGDLARTGDYTLSFKLDCNATFAIRVGSLHGGFAHVGAVAPPEGFAASLDYNVALSVGTDLGSVGGQCAASALAGDSCALAGPQGRGLSSGNGVAIGADGQLTLHWTPQQKLVGGNYQDSIVITVEART